MYYESLMHALSSYKGLGDFFLFHSTSSLHTVRKCISKKKIRALVFLNQTLKIFPEENLLKSFYLHNELANFVELLVFSQLSPLIWIKAEKVKCFQSQTSQIPCIYSYAKCSFLLYDVK